MVATIKKNSRGDLFSTGGAWEVTQLFFKNYALELLESLPGLKSVSKAFRKTMSELDIEFSQVYDRVRQRVLEKAVPLALPPHRAERTLPMLEYKPLALPPAEDQDEEGSAKPGPTEVK